MLMIRMESSAKPKVALMSYSMDNRRAMGTALYTRRLIEGLLADSRFEWYLVHFDRVDDPLYAKAREIVMPEIPKLPFATRFVRTMLFFWKYRKENFDIVHWFQPRLYPFFWSAPAKHIVVTAHGAGEMYIGLPFIFSSWVYQRMMVHFNRYMAAVIGVSQFAKREIEEWYRVPPEKTFVTYPGGGERFAPIPRDEARERVRERFGVADPFILDVSRLEPHKNVGTLIKAYRIAREQGIRQKLVLVGKDSGLYAQLRDLAASTGYGDDIVFVPYATDEELNTLYAAADLFAFPSLNEGFGLPLVEAMSTGTPVITSNVASMPEIAGDAGVVIDPRNEQDLASAIVRLVSDEKLQESLRARGFERAKRFRWTETVRETIKLYEDILGYPVNRFLRQ